MQYYVFAYGSLMDAESARVTLGYTPNLRPASLSGFRTAWNVATRINEGRNLGRVALYADGSPYDGLLVPIGLEAGEGYHTQGMVFQTSESDLDALDEREVNYDRVDVTHEITWLDGGAPSGTHQVYTYVPKPASVAMLHEAAKGGMKVVVTKSYLDILHHVAERYEYAAPLVIPAPHWQVHDVRLHSSSS